MRARLLAALTLATAPTMAAAHLLPRQTATLRLVDQSAFAVVSVPASTLDGVDEDGDGLISAAELERHSDEVSRQVQRGFTLSDDAATAVRTSVYASLPHTDGDGGGSDYVVVLQRTDFDRAPLRPIVAFSLFGPGSAETTLSMKASRNGRVEVAVLTPDAPSHAFRMAGAD